MKVITIGSDRALFRKGSAVRDRVLSYGTIADELHIIVFTLGFQGFKKEQLGTNVWLYPTNSFWELSYVLGARRIARAILGKHQSEKDWLISTQDPFESGLAGYLAASSGVPLHVQLHTDVMSPYFAQENFLNRIRVWIAQFVLKRAAAVRVVSERVRASIEKLGVPPSSISVLPIRVPNIDTPYVGIGMHEKYPQWQTIVLMASRLTHEKDIPTALAAFARVAASDRTSGLVIAGAGPLEASLMKEARMLGIEDRVIFEGWQEGVSSFMTTSDIFLSTSLYEGFGLALLEAAMVGNPIITTDVGLVGSVLEDGESCLVCPVGDVSCIALKLERLIGDREYRKELGAKAKETAKPVLVSEEEYLKRYRASWELALKS